jgi:tetratricopeptide (TPR) repeat protein
VLIWDSHAAAHSGQVDEAEALARQSYALYEELGDPANRAFGLGELAVRLMYAGKYDEACQVLRQSLELHEDLGNRATRAYTQGWLAVAFLGTGEYATAHTLSQQATAQARELPGATGSLARWRAADSSGV